MEGTNNNTSTLGVNRDKFVEAEAAEVASNALDTHETELRQTLKERHVNMIGFSTTLGVGLFLSAGKSIFLAGPGMAVIAFLIMGTVMWSVMASLGEMTALFPVKGPTFEFARRFVDESIGLATGWITWFSWVAITAAEVLAITEIFRFKFDPDYLQEQGYPETRVEWRAGLDTSPGVWVGIFLIVILLANLLPVRLYGRLEYVFGSLKIIFLVGLIMFNLILNARQRFHATRFGTYETPWGFATQNMTLRVDSDGEPTLVLTGSLGQLTAFWSAMTTTIFSLMGWEMILITAPENKDLQGDETIKIASRKISIRVLVLYCLAAFTVGLNVPYSDANLRNLTIYGITGGQNSAFVIAAIREHVKFLPHLFNAFFIFSACSTGICALYGASRILHALVQTGTDLAWSSCNAVFASWLVGFLAFLSTRPAAAETLGRIVTTTVVGNLIVYAVNCVAYLKFYRAVNKAAKGESDEDLGLTPGMRALYRRSAKQYPYRSHLQWIRAAYALTSCVLMTIFQGWRTFITPMSVKDFVASYIAIILFLVISLAYFFMSRGFSPQDWRVRNSGLVGLESVGPIAVSPENINTPCSFCGAQHRRGHLRLPEKDFFTAGNMRAIVEWIWVWLK